VRTLSYVRGAVAKSPAPVGALRVQHVGIKFNQVPALNMEAGVNPPDDQ